MADDTPQRDDLLAGSRVLPAGDACVAIELGNEATPRVNARVHALDALIDAAQVPGLLETVPTYRSLLVEYDPLVISPGELIEKIRAVASSGMAAVPPGRCWTIPVAYGGEHGMDLDFVASEKAMSRDDVARLHQSAEYRVYMIGFAPGFAYLGGLPPALHLPRRATPRPRIPAGSVSIGGIQASIASVAMPSGWHVLGRTPMRLFDLRRADPFLLHAGDQVRFTGIDAEEFRQLDALAATGELTLHSEPTLGTAP